jgi:signal transduction histidine kinase
MTTNSEEYEQLARRLAHDLNNLLTPIKGYSVLALQRANGDDRIRDYLEEIKKAAERATDLTQQLMAFGSMLDSDPEPGPQEPPINYET